jgi:hypothetical protein
MEEPVKAAEPVEQQVDVGRCVKSKTIPFGPEQPEQPAQEPAPAEPPAEQPNPKMPRAKRVAKVAVPPAPPKPELNPSDLRFWGGLLAEYQAQQRSARINKYSSLFKM